MTSTFTGAPTSSTSRRIASCPRRENRIDAVGARLRVQAAAPHGVVELTAAEEHVHAGVQHHVDAGVAAGPLDRREPLRVELRICEGTGLVVGVLEVESDSARLQEPLDELARLEPVARLEVGGHGHVHDRGDAGHGREHLVRRRHVPVLVPECLGHAGAGGRDRRIAVVREPARAGRIPRVHEQQRRAGHVQPAQLVGLGRQGRRVHDAAAGTAGRSSRSSSTSRLPTTSRPASTRSGIL